MNELPGLTVSRSTAPVTASITTAYTPTSDATAPAVDRPTLARVLGPLSAAGAGRRVRRLSVDERMFVDVQGSQG